jgi:hypothetical protein
MADAGTTTARSTGGGQAGAASGAISTGAPAKKNKKIPLGRLARLRCNHAPLTWLPGLGVLWRPKPKPVAPPASAQPSGAPGSVEQAAAEPFNMSITDWRGYLAPPSDVRTEKAKAAWIKSHPMLEGVEYEFYFVRHPDTESYLGKVADDINAGRKPYDIDPIALTAEVEDTDKTNKRYDELVVKIPEDPDLFIPPGSEAFDTWLLYAQMPHANCPPVQEKVKKLQQWLGAIRYVVGAERGPYRPVAPDEQAALNVPSKMRLEGFFSPYVLNAVLGFQRNVLAGDAIQLRGGLHKEWLASPPKSEVEADFAEEYRSNERASAGEVQGDEPPSEDAVVDKATGDALKKWIDKDLRRPGKILVVGQAQIVKKTSPIAPYRIVYHWLREEAADAFRNWEAAAKGYGMPPLDSIDLAGTYRACEVDVVGAGYGRAQFSIHKTALAIDLSTGNYIGAGRDFPFFRVRKDTGDRTRWVLYTKVAKTVEGRQADAKARAEAAEEASEGVGIYPYEQDIPAWRWDGTHERGGSTFSPGRLDDDHAYLNLTYLAHQVGLTEISAFRDHWFAILGEEIRYGSPDTFEKLVSRLVAHASFAKDTPFHKVPGQSGYFARFLDWVDDPDPAPSPLIPGTALSMTDAGLANEVARLKWWLNLTRSPVWIKPKSGRKSKQRPLDLDAAPTVEIDPKLEVHQGFLDKLMGQKPPNQHPLMLEQGGASSEINPYPSYPFPKEEKFRLTPKMDVLALGEEEYFLFPQINGEAIGQEWWHFELTEKDKSWMTLMQDIGWCKEGLMRTEEPALYRRSGVGYKLDQVMKQDKTWAATLTEVK